MQAPTLNRITQTAHLASKAVDHSAKPDNVVYAPEDGKVVSYGQAGAPGSKTDAGNQLRMQGATGLHAFSHLEKSLVKVGATVKRGQKIAVMGHTGYTIPDGPLGAHLHYWIKTPSGYVYPPTLYKDKFIKGEPMVTNPNHLDILFVQFLGRKPTKAEKAKYLDKSHVTILEYLYKRRVNVPALIKSKDSQATAEAGKIKALKDKIITFIKGA